MAAPEFDFGQIEDDAGHAAPPLDDPYDLGTTLVADAATTVVTGILLTINGWPESKIVMEEQCVKVFGKRICTKVPVGYARVSKIEIIASISFPSIQAIQQQVKDCLDAAIAASAITVVYSEQYEAASAALLAYLKICLVAKGIQDVSRIQVGIAAKITPGPWHR